MPIELKPHWLPSLPMIEKYLQPEISVVWADAKGITIEGYGAGLTPALSLPVAAPMSAAFLMPAIARSTGRAKRAVSMAHLNAIAKAVALYESEYEATPPNLAKLVEAGNISADSLVSPISGRTMPTDAKGMPTGQSDYVYFVMSQDMPGDLIRAYERPENYRNKGTCVLLVNGSVRWMDRPQFENLLKRTLEARKKAPKTADF